MDASSRLSSIGKMQGGSSSYEGSYEEVIIIYPETVASTMQVSASKREAFDILVQYLEPLLKEKDPHKKAISCKMAVLAVEITHTEIYKNHNPHIPKYLGKEQQANLILDVLLDYEHKGESNQAASCLKKICQHEKAATNYLVHASSLFSAATGIDLSQGRDKTMSASKFIGYLIKQAGIYNFANNSLTSDDLRNGVEALNNSAKLFLSEDLGQGFNGLKAIYNDLINNLNLSIVTREDIKLTLDKLEEINIDLKALLVKMNKIADLAQEDKYLSVINSQVIKTSSAVNSAIQYNNSAITIFNELCAKLDEQKFMP